MAFDVGRQHCGLVVEDVERAPRAVTPAPKAPEIVEGLINVAGTPVAVFDICKRLGFRPKPVDIGDVLILT